MKNETIGPLSENEAEANLLPKPATTFSLVFILLVTLLLMEGVVKLLLLPPATESDKEDED